MVGCCIFFSALPFLTSAFNYPEKASQRQRGNALGNYSCAQSLPCSGRSGISYRLITSPPSLSSSTDSSDVQTDKAILQNLRQDPLPGTVLSWGADSSHTVQTFALGVPNGFATTCQNKKVEGTTASNHFHLLPHSSERFCGEEEL